MKKVIRNTCNRKVNTSWLLCSFDKDNKVPCVTETTQKRKRKLKNNCAETETKSRGVKVSESGLKQESLLWVERYSPKTKEHLAVNKKKIVQVEEWLNQTLCASSQQKASILLLTGPAGCGKSATVKVLANELKLDLKEWSNTSQQISQDTWDYGYYSNVTTESQIALFNTFLLQGNKYPAVLMRCNCQRLILVDEYPNSYLKDASLFHSLLRKYQKTTRCPMVFIVSDNSRGDSLEQLLFPKPIVEELNISVISFNPVPPTLMFKMLQRIAQDYNVLPDDSKKRKSALENITACSSGDIRNAINGLQFMHNQTTRHTFWKDRKKLDIAETSNTVSSVGRDASLFLFHSLGKILYCKREPTLQEDGIPLKMAHLKRPSLKENPEEVFEKTSISNVAFNLFLHQNYLDFLDKIENISECCTYFSDSDIICSDWTDQKALQNYGTSIVTRSLMFHLYSSNIKNKWKPLCKPQWYNKQKMYNTNFVELKNINQRWKINTKEIQTQLLPYLVKLSPLKLTEQERQFVTKYKVFSSKHGTRTSTNSLGEREAFEDKSGPDFAIENVLCKASYNVEENEEEYLIEEFDD